MRIAGQGHILLPRQNVLYPFDVYIPDSSSLCNSYGGSHTGSLTRAHALRNEVQPVDGNIVSGDVAAGAEQSFHLLRQNRPIGNLHGTAIVDLTDGRVPLQ